MKTGILTVGCAFVLSALLLAGAVVAQDKKADQPTTAPSAQASGDLAPLQIELPKPRFEGTPKNAPQGVRLDPSLKGPRAPFLAPKGITNVAKGKTVTSSDSMPIIGSLDQITDGDKEAVDGSYVELASGTQWVQIDLGTPTEINAILIWHRHNDARVYRDVIVQTASDPDFIENVVTLFNNDFDNSSGLGIGKDYEYFDSYEGKLIDGKNTKARYVRFYSRGSTSDSQNHYTEIEVFAKPAK